MGIFDFDRTWKNNSDGQTFYGKDDKERGTTDWYGKDGTLDSVTKTPKSWEQDMNDEGY